MRNGPHILLCSESSTGKTSFAAQLIGCPPAIKDGRPVLVQGFDPSDKMTPYRRRGDRLLSEPWKYGRRERIMRGKECVAILERWHESEGRAGGGVTMSGGGKVQTAKYVLQGTKFEDYLERMTHFVAECDDEYFGYIHDSSTFCQHAASAYLQGVMKVSDNQLVYAQVTDELERFYLATFPELPITTIVISHSLPQRVTERDEKGRKRRVRGAPGDVPYEARLPGRLANDIFATFGEIYRAFYDRKTNGYYLQTRRDEVWLCQSQLGVPDPLGPSPTFKEIYEQAAKLQSEEVA